MTPIEQALNECRSYTLRTGREYGIVLSGDHIDQRSEGTSDAVEFDNERLMALRWASVPTTVCHSHPDDSPFSPQDLAMARVFGTSGGVITPDGSIFTFEKSNLGNPDVGDHILRGIFTTLSYVNERYHFNKESARAAAILTFNRQAAKRGLLEGYKEQLGPVLAEESDHLRRLGQ